MSFKDKPLKKIVADKRVTLDVIHNDIVSGFKDNKGNYLSNKKLLDELLKYKNSCKNEIKKLTKEIKEYEKNNLDNETNYYLDTSLLLNEYYNGKNNEINTKKVNGKNIISLMNEKADTNHKKKEVNKQHSIIDSYMSKINDKILLDYGINDNEDCPHCNITFVIKHLESKLICEKCGYTKEIIINSEKVSYKDPPRETSFFAYKRINHFNEWIAQFQAKETTDIPDEVYKGIISELNKNKNLKLHDVKYKHIREILKKLKYNKYYEHIPHIINIINGNKAPLLSINQEDQLRMMFKEIQQPFMKHCPEERKNFLSYSYVLHKFCELIELDHLLENFPYLKSREKLQQQDIIWQKICGELSWEYIPSV
jgi:ribosomal protein S27AE